MTEVARFYEGEPFPKYDVVMLGAGHGTGLVIAQKLALEGYKVHIGTRSHDSFVPVRQSILDVRGIEPAPFIADLTKPEEIINALQKSGIKPGQPVHYFDFAAEGIKGYLRFLARPLASLEAAYNEKNLTGELAEQLTRDIKAGVTTERALRLANRVNRDAPSELGELLKLNGNLGKGSVIATLSSSISDYTDPNAIESYPGPWMYWPIGSSKAAGMRRMGELADQTGARHLDCISPEIKETDPIKIFNTLLPMLQALQPGTLLHIPSVSKEQVANILFRELMRTDVPLTSRKVYITENGPVYQLPNDWNIPVLPYL